MIYPARLILWLCFILPLSAAAGYFTSAAVLMLLLYTVILLWAAADLFRGIKTIGNINAELNGNIKTSVFSLTSLPFQFNNYNKKDIQLHLKIQCPDTIIPEKDLYFIKISPDNLSECSINITPLDRGTFTIEKVFLEINSPGNFWKIRKKIILDKLKITVYPNLKFEKRSLAALFLHHTNGIHIHRMLGQGREFEKLREYIHGDSMDIISWKATAKRNKPISKVFKIEQTQNIYAVIDVSRLSSQHLPDSKRVIDHYLSSSLILGQIAAMQKDAFGVIAFDSNVCRFIKAKTGKVNYNACREAIFNLEPSERIPDYRNLFSFIRTKVHKRALLLFMIDVSNPATLEAITENIHLISSKYLAVINTIKHKTERPLFSEKITEEEEIFSHFAGHLQWENIIMLKKQLMRHGITLTSSDYNQLTSDVVTQYINVKKRQVL